MTAKNEIFPNGSAWTVVGQPILDAAHRHGRCILQSERLFAHIPASQNATVD